MQARRALGRVPGDGRADPDLRRRAPQRAHRGRRCGGNASRRIDGSYDRSRAQRGPAERLPDRRLRLAGLQAERQALRQRRAGFGLDGEVGIGAVEGANIHLEVDNSLDFTTTTSSCDWTLELGKFAINGKLGPVDIHGPSSPPLVKKTLSHQACGSPPALVPAPLPAPAPAPAPPLAPQPLTRATMTWGTDADVDLYAWDEAGDLLYFGNRTGIPGAQLVEDIIPSEGESVHPPEVFQETSIFNRRLTFGICDYHLEGGRVTLTVVDPGGASRSFAETLYEEGEGLVVTTSPLGGGYEPEPGWCRSSSDR